MKTKIKEFFQKNYLMFFNIYLISVFIKNSTFIIDYPVFNNVQRGLRLIAFFLMTIRCVVILPELLELLKIPKWKEKNNKQKLILIITSILCLGVLINTIKIRNIRMISILLVIISAYGIDIKKIIKNLLIMQFTMTLIIVSSSIFGLIQDYVIFRSDDDVSRHSLGFTYTTNLSQMVFFMSLIYLYIKKFKIEFPEILILQILNIFTYYLTDSKTEILGFEAIVIVCILLNINLIKNIVPKLCNIATKLFIFIPILSLNLVFLYPAGGMMNKIDSALSGRLSVQYDVISNGNIKLFGADIKMVGYGLEDEMAYDVTKAYNYIDNDYIQVLVINGVVVAGSIVVLIYITIRKLDKEKNYNEIILIYTYLLFGVINPRIIELMYSPVLFFIIPTIFNRKIN